MPDWSNYFFSYDAGVSTSGGYITPTQLQQLQQQWEEYQQRQAEQHQRAQYLWEQRTEKEKQLQEDKENYPLFFLKEGIV